MCKRYLAGITALGSPVACNEASTRSGTTAEQMRAANLESALKRDAARDRQERIADFREVALAYEWGG